MNSNNYILLSNGGFISEYELYHHGVKGQKWGVRRYQNEDGTLTAAGKKRYTNSDGSLNEKGKKKFGDSVKTAASSDDKIDSNTAIENINTFANITRGAAAVASAIPGIGSIASVSSAVIWFGSSVCVAILKKRKESETN